MKLYEVPDRKFVRTLNEEKAPVGCEPIAKGKVFKFIKLDGM